MRKKQREREKESERKREKERERERDAVARIYIRFRKDYENDVSLSLPVRASAPTRARSSRLLSRFRRSVSRASLVIPAASSSRRQRVVRRPSHAARAAALSSLFFFFSFSPSSYHLSRLSSVFTLVGSPPRRATVDTRAPPLVFEFPIRSTSPWSYVRTNVAVARRVALEGKFERGGTPCALPEDLS